MPRANRYFVPGYAYHLTHRCHNREFLLRFATDRDRYRKVMREGVLEFGVSLLDFCVTSNHTHLLAYAEGSQPISAFMQRVEGESRIRGRQRLEVVGEAGHWILREVEAAYGVARGLITRELDTGQPPRLRFVRHRPRTHARRIVGAVGRSASAS